MKTDTQLQQDVIAELKWDPSINAADIGVEVKQGVVTLSGHVNSYSEKWDAERAAQRVTGVKALAVEMDVTLPALSKRNDADIARAAENILEWMTNSPEDAVKVKVMCEDGWITLTGEVQWQYQRQAAADAIRHLMGVNGVSNDLVISARGTSGIIKSDIDAALRRRSLGNSSDISVEVLDSGVRLSGTMHSWLAHDLALHAAWGTPGVKRVIDNMELAL